MKKVILFIAIFLAIFSFSFGQSKNMHKKHIKNEQIAFMVYKSSVLSGLKNKNLIYPGYYLKWEYPDGYDELIKIKKGDCMWKISKKLLEDYIPQEFPIDNFYSFDESSKKVYTKNREETKSSLNVLLYSFPSWLWIAIGFVVVLLSAGAYVNDKDQKEKARKNKRIDI